MIACLIKHYNNPGGIRLKDRFSQGEFLSAPSGQIPCTKNEPIYTANVFSDVEKWISNTHRIAVSLHSMRASDLFKLTATSQSYPGTVTHDATPQGVAEYSV